MAHSLISYINSEMFLVDTSVVRTGDDSCEWIEYRFNRGATRTWFNGHLHGVRSAKRHSGTIAEFAERQRKNLSSKWKLDPDWPDLDDIVRSFVEGMPVVR
jgi:hypothetical protein